MFLMFSSLWAMLTNGILATDAGMSGLRNLAESAEVHSEGVLARTITSVESDSAGFAAKIAERRATKAAALKAAMEFNS